MKKKNAKTVLILLSVTMIFVTVFAIISLTYSWYNKETNADITSINMSTIDSGGILLSGNGLSWSSTLTTDGGISSIDIDESLLINSISTSGTVVDGEIQFFSGDFDNNVFTTTLIDDETLFYVFDIFILNSDPVEKKLTLGMDSSVTDVNNKDVELSTRVAFLNLGNASDIAGAQLLDGTGITDVDYIWEPNSTTRNEKIDLYHSDYVPEGKVSYEGVNLAASDLTLDDNLVIDSIGTPEQEVLEVTTYDPIDAGDEDDITLLMSDSITRLRVYIWSEGQDIDSTNSISGGAADLAFSFNSYNVELVGENYVPIEKFNTPTLTNSASATYTWSATTTDLSATTYSTDYMFRISKYIEGDLTTIRTVNTTSTSLDIDSLTDLGLGEYYVELKVHSEDYGDSDYSSSLTFDVLASPEDFALATSTVSWTAVTNAESYTITVYDENTETTYTTTTTSISLDLSTRLFDGSVYIPTGEQYEVSVKANGNLGYANSEYTETITWLY